MRALIQEVRDADDSWVGHDPEAAGRYWAARGALDAACHPSTIDDDGLGAALRAIDAEVHQTQRRMIAALYWRAGVLSAGGYLVPAVHIISMAQDMEATCAR